MAFIIPHEIKRYCHISVYDKTIVHAKSMPHDLLPIYEQTKEDYEKYKKQFYKIKYDIENE